VLHRLRRHPIPMVARFRHSLVLTYAFPHEVLEPLLPAGLILDRHGELGFAAVAIVQTEAMRPVGVPAALGRDHALVGYRIFCRFRTPEGRLLRGLHILRSDAASRSMVVAGNLLTHYRYRRSAIDIRADGDALRVFVESPDGAGDLRLVARLDSRPAPLPPGSPFSDARQARRFAGPLPFTFDHEPETRSIVVIEGVRSQWEPQPVTVDVARMAFFETDRFGGVRPVLANAFHIADVPYRWRRGRPMAIEATR
jgi:hypothetical protein